MLNISNYNKLGYYKLVELDNLYNTYKETDIIVLNLMMGYKSEQLKKIKPFLVPFAMIHLVI